MTRIVETASRGEMSKVALHFDYAAPAEVFMAPGGFRKHAHLTYRSFASSALAIKFAMEEVPERLRNGMVMEVSEERFDHRAIRHLYDEPAYPLARP
jgi:hypothetical protein